MQVRDRAAGLAREARQRADELEAVFAGMDEAVMVYDTMGRPTKANQAAVRAYGFDPVGSDRETRARALNLRYPDGGRFRPMSSPPAARSGGSASETSTSCKATRRGRTASSAAPPRRSS